MLKRRIAQFTKEDCFALIGSVQLYPQSGGIREAEEHLIRRLSAIIKYDSDEEILEVFKDLARHLGDPVKVSILDLGGTKVSSETLKALVELFPNVKELNISRTKVTEIPPGPWENLKTLHVRHSLLQSIEGLANTGIQHLDISGNKKIKKIPSGPWKNLKTLHAQYTLLQSIEGLENTGIEKIYLSESKNIETIPSGPWKNLKKLDASSCSRLTCIKGLENTGIEEIDISEIDVTEMPPGPWKNLKKLRL